MPALGPATCKKESSGAARCSNEKEQAEMITKKRLTKYQLYLQALKNFFIAFIWYKLPIFLQKNIISQTMITITFRNAWQRKPQAVLVKPVPVAHHSKTGIFCKLMEQGIGNRCCKRVCTARCGALCGLHRALYLIPSFCIHSVICLVLKETKS